MENSIDTIFDKQFQRIPLMHWLPWVGKDYTKTPSGKKLLIVGESHYVPNDENAEDGYNDDTWTRKFISKEGLRQSPLYAGDPINPLIKNTEKTIFNTQNPTDENKQKLWYSSVFFNLIQRLLLSKNKDDRPNDNDFIEGWEVFLSLVDIIKPNICLILGKSSCGRLGYYLSNNDTGWVKKDSEFYEKDKVITLSKNGDAIKLIFIKHPSSYFSWGKWAKFIDIQMKECTTWLRENLPTNC